MDRHFSRKFFHRRFVNSVGIEIWIIFNNKTVFCLWSSRLSFLHLFLREKKQSIIKWNVLLNNLDIFNYIIYIYIYTQKESKLQFRLQHYQIHQMGLGTDFRWINRGVKGFVNYRENFTDLSQGEYKRRGFALFAVFIWNY